MRNVKLPSDFGDGATSNDARRLGMDAARAPKLLGMATKAYQRQKLDMAYDAAFLAVSCDRHLLDGWLLLGGICANLEAYAEAQECFRTVLTAQPDHLGAYAALGEVSIALKDFSGATQALQKVVQLDPHGKNEASLRARMLLVSRGQWKLGLQALSAMTQLAQKAQQAQAKK